MVRATRVGEKAGAVGFDWPDAAGVREKVNEKLAELAMPAKRVPGIDTPGSGG
jgi:uncharacterized protein YabN with tetrapyrrole methylase and pyrophosphatase domain